MSRVVVSKHKAFLAAFAQCASISKASKAAKIHGRQHYQWLKEKEGYAEEFRAACDQAAQILEDEAVRRAHGGVFVPNVYQGGFVYPQHVKRTPVLTKTGKQKIENGKPKFTEEITYGKKPLGTTVYSDPLLMFLLRGWRPERYRDRVSAEVTGANGGPISLEQQRLMVLSDDELTNLIAVSRKLVAAAPPDGSGVTETQPE